MASYKEWAIKQEKLSGNGANIAGFLFGPGVGKDVYFICMGNRFLGEWMDVKEIEEDLLPAISSAY